MSFEFSVSGGDKPGVKRLELELREDGDGEVSLVEADTGYYLLSLGIDGQVHLYESCDATGLPVDKDGRLKVVRDR